MQIKKESNSQSDQTIRYTDRLINRQTNRLTERKTNRQRVRHENHNRDLKRVQGEEIIIETAKSKLMKKIIEAIKRKKKRDGLKVRFEKYVKCNHEIKRLTKQWIKRSKLVYIH